MQAAHTASRRGLILFLLLCFAAALLLGAAFYLYYIDRGYLEVAFLDVGQGDAALVYTPEHQTILIDGGEPSAGQYDLLPYLRARGIHTLDAAIVTHCHDDHYGGVLTLLQAEDFTVKALYLHAPVPHSDGAAAVFEAARQKGVATQAVMAGDRLAFSDTVLSVLAPSAAQLEAAEAEANATAAESAAENEASIVLKLTYGETAFLFTGDCSGDAADALIQQGGLSADVLKLAHHGSAAANKLGFLQAVQPRYAVISVGTDNIYRLPSAETLANLTLLGLQPLRTDLDGMIVFTVTEDGIQKIETGRDREQEDAA